MPATNENASQDPMAPVGLEQIGECRVLRDVSAQPGVRTVEGTMVPLLSGKNIRSHIIEMHSGQYCFAHPHDTESIIYTVSGRWVFCTTDNGEEVRTVINANDLFHFPGGVPTGFETPFDEDAVILITKEGGEPYEEMVSGMEWARDELAEESAAGTPFYFGELPPHHPARVYAREVAGRDPGSDVGAT